MKERRRGVRKEKNEKRKEKWREYNGKRRRGGNRIEKERMMRERKESKWEGGEGEEMKKEE